MPSTATLARLLLILALLGAVTAFFAFGLQDQLSLDALKAHQRAFGAYRQAHPLWLAAGFFLLYVIFATLPLPGAELLTIAAGAIFGLVEGTLLVSFASCIGATLAMLSSRFVLGGWVRKRFAAPLKKVDEGIAREGGFYLFSLRLVPVVPFFAINLLTGLTRLPVRTFYWVSQLGMLAGTLVYVNAGTQLAGLHSLSGLLSPGLIGSFLLLAALPWIARAGLLGVKRRHVYRKWRKPKRFDRNLVVIGAGSAGLVSAYIAASVRAKVTLIEKNEMGGDCLNTGCVPSKALIRIARAAHEVRQARRFGIEASASRVDFAAAMRQVHAAIAAVAPHDSVARYRELGVDVRRGQARIVSPWVVEVDGEPISTRAIVIAAGAEPRVPDLPGLAEAGYLTSDTVWTLESLPERLLVFGGGPIGCELAQAFARLGSEVTMVQRAERLLTREDDEVSDCVRQHLENEGVRVLTEHKAVAVEQVGGARQLVCEHAATRVTLPFDALLVAVGRMPRTAGYGLDDLKLPLTPKRTIETDAWLQTLYPNIYACGDVAGPWQFTHAAAHQAWYATVNALFGGLKRFRVDERVMPTVTFTDPEVARVGMNEREARARGIDHEVTRFDLAELDRAIAEQVPQGFVKLLTVPGKDRLLGATCVGPHAGEWIAEWALAMRHRIGLNGVLKTVHAYPTFAEANKYAAGAWRKAHVSERVLRLLARWFRWRRHSPERPATPRRKETLL
jgi:pyruvate/2-oxoglutarate dehydrogenase complex dihydrolipoamide dehydrogenase (E3) component/uncharacterized membrane protein YdjX (TVP38/TMEM64 family)